jgi:hypothetical protein
LVEQPPCPSLSSPDIDLDVRSESDMGNRGIDEGVSWSAQPPERGAEVGIGPLLTGLNPQASSDKKAMDDPLLEGQKSQKTLGAERKMDGASITPELESLDQA